MDDKVVMCHDLAGEEELKSAVIVGTGGIYHANIDLEAWKRVITATKFFVDGVSASFETLKPVIEEVMRKQQEEFSRYREDIIKEFTPIENYFIGGGTRAGLVAAMEEMQRRRDAEVLTNAFKQMGTELPFEAPYQEQDWDGRWLALLEQLEQEKVRQKQLHKKKGKTVKNWQRNKFWQRGVK